MVYRDILVVSGPAGSGKNSLLARILPDLPGYELTRSVTTRPFRQSDDPVGRGLNSKYVYVDPVVFQRLIDNGLLLEHNPEYAGHLYGALLPRESVCPVLEIDMVGARQIKERYHGQVRHIFVTVPGRTVDEKLKELRRRILGRAEEHGTDIDVVDLAKRLGRAEEELTTGPDEADVILMNDDRDRAATALWRYIKDKPRG